MTWAILPSISGVCQLLQIHSMFNFAKYALILTTTVAIPFQGLPARSCGCTASHEAARASTCGHCTSNMPPPAAPLGRPDTVAAPVHFARPKGVAAVARPSVNVRTARAVFTARASRENRFPLQHPRLSSGHSTKCSRWDFQLFRWQRSSRP